MVNRPEGPTLTKSYRQRKNKGAVSGYGNIGGKGNGKEKGSRKFQAAHGRIVGTGIFSWIGGVIFDDADECISMGKYEEESHNPMYSRNLSCTCFCG